MDISFAEKPELFGTLHITFAVIIIVFNTAVCRFVRNRREEFLLHLLRAAGLIMMVAEVFKQWFCYKYICGGQINLWYFPWQLCSVAMYLAFAAVYLKGRSQEAVLVYLSSFSLFGAVMALAFPEGMLFNKVILTVHSFVYHALIISVSLIAIEILKKREKPSFRGALVLFGITALIAEIINIISRYIMHDPVREPDMFYINPFYTTSQPVFRDIALIYGNIAEISVYLLCVILASYLIFIAEDRLFYRKGNIDGLTR